jgi:phosphoribosylanthranilate isomerase
MALIKICGNVRHEDAMLVASFQPDFMGWIFSPFSKRRVDRSRAARMIRSVRLRHPGIRHVGVFAGNSVLSILALSRYLFEHEASLDFLQVTEGAGFIHRLRDLQKKESVAVPVIPVLRPTQRIDNLDFFKTSPSPLWVLDRYDPAARGGTGQTIDPSLFAPVRYPFLIAGGINAENARRLLTESGAIGIDLSSGVESAPGEKDPRKLEDLFRVMR